MPPKLANSVMTLARTAVSVDVSSAEKEEKYVSSLLGGGCNNILKKDLVTGLVHALALLKHHIVKVDQAAKDAGVSDKIPGLPLKISLFLIQCPVLEQMLPPSQVRLQPCQALTRYVVM